MSTDSEKSRRGDQVKVVLRKLPKYMTESEVLEQISPLPTEVIETFFRPANFAFDRAAFATLTLVFSEYCDSLMDFERRFDGYIFVDSRGNDSAAVVEAAVNQQFSKCDRARMKQDTRVGAIDTDKYYLDFCKKLEEEKAMPIMTLEQQIRKLNQPEDARAQIGRLETPLVKFFMEKEGGKKLDRKKLKEKKTEKKKNIMDMLMKPAPSSASTPSTSGAPTPSTKPSKPPKDPLVEKEKAEKKKERNALRKQKFMDERRKQKEELEQENPKPPRTPGRENNKRRERMPKPPRPTPAKTLGEQQGEDWIKKLTDPKAAPIKKKHDIPVLIDCVQKRGSSREGLTRPTHKASSSNPSNPSKPSNSLKLPFGCFKESSKLPKTTSKSK